MRGRILSGSGGNRDKAALNLLINAVEYIIYNNETKLLFRTDGEGGGEKSE